MRKWEVRKMVCAQVERAQKIVRKKIVRSGYKSSADEAHLVHPFTKAESHNIIFLNKTLEGRELSTLKRKQECDLLLGNVR